MECVESCLAAGAPHTDFAAVRRLRSGGAACALDYKIGIASIPRV
jgi:hypothetical protein